jgi:tight adherence protein B
MVRFDPSRDTLRTALVAAFVLGTAAVVYVMTRDPQSAVHRKVARHLESLRQRFADLFIFVDPKVILFGQAFAVYVFAALAIANRDEDLLLPGLVALVLPEIILSKLRARRRAQLELQADGFVLTLASAMQSTPSISDAFMSTQSALSEPLRSEIALASKHIKLGATFEQAIAFMGRRIGSHAFDVALTSILIGQRLGGDMPSTLAATGEALRDLRRLERASRARLSANRNQVRTMALLPPMSLALMHAMMPEQLGVLRSHPLGPISMGIGALLWIAGVVIAHRMLRVTV